MKTSATLSAMFAIVLAMGSQADGAPIFTSRDGWSIEGDPGSEAPAIEMMQRGEEQESRGELRGAVTTYKQLLRRYPVSNLAPKAQFKVARILEAGGEYDDAYDAYANYLTKYPRGEDFETSVESMFKIAQLFLEGEKRKIFGLKIASSMTRAQEMFEGIVQRAPYSRYAPLAQFNAGQAMEKQGKFSDAIAAYTAVVTRYPSDPIADDAQYQIGFVQLRQYRDGSYDQGGAQKARDAFEDFINRFPDSEKVPQARENLKSLEAGASKGTLDIAKFYDKTKKYKAAVIYYNDVIKFSPGTPEATFAKTRIDELRAKHGDDALRPGPERAETGAKAAERRRLQAKVETVSRPDYAGPPVSLPRPDEVAPGRPRLRTEPLGPIPAVEPELPATDPFPADDTPTPEDSTNPLAPGSEAAEPNP
jgi:outer membrane protein assembly factor BamD